MFSIGVGSKVKIGGLKRVLPERAVALIGRARKKLKKARIASLPALGEDEFTNILADRLGLCAGDTVFIHSSMDQLHLGFSYGRVLPLVREVIGERGTMLFPTYPKLSSHEFLSRGEVFDVRRTPSFMGILTEFARRQKDAVRSLHPTKSVCAIGRHARELTATHHLSPYPYDDCSPYYKVSEYGGKIVGLGVSTRFLSFVHCVDDALKESFPVEPYHRELFDARCVDYDGRVEVVSTYAHDLRKMNHDIPRFIRTHIPAEACADLTIKGMKFYRGDAPKLFERMLRLAGERITIYPRAAYRDEARRRRG